jgi:cation/acetate symporter
LPPQATERFVMIGLSPPVWPGPDSEGSPSPFIFPGLVTIPIGFLGCWLGTMLSSERETARSYDELLVRSEIGLGSEAGAPARRRRRRAMAGATAVIK